MFKKEGGKNLEMELMITKRPATDADTEFARTVHHTAYYDVIVQQFGSFNEKMQDDFFFKSWKPETHEILLSDGIEAGYISIEYFPDHIVAHELVLLPEFQGKGIGSKLLKEVLEEAKIKHIPVQLRVLKKILLRIYIEDLDLRILGRMKHIFIWRLNPLKIKYYRSVVKVEL